MAQQHADAQPQAGAVVRQLLPGIARHQTNGTGTQRDERVDGITGQYAADDVGHRTHGKACPGPEQQCGQQHRQAAQVEPNKAGGDAQHPAEHDAHGHQQCQHDQCADGSSGWIVHINCPPLSAERNQQGRRKTPSLRDKPHKGGRESNKFHFRARRQTVSPAPKSMQQRDADPVPRVHLRPQHNSPLMRHLTHRILLC